VLNSFISGTGSGVLVDWDGRDSRGILMPDDVYDYTFYAQDAGGNYVQRSGNFTLDTTP